MSFKNAVCRGSLALGSACGRCERCDLERKRLQAVAASKEDAFQPDLFDNAKSYASGGVVNGSDEPKPVVHVSCEQFMDAKHLNAISSNIGSIVVGSLKHGSAEYFANGDVKLHDQMASSPIKGHSGLPVAGYAKTVEQWKIDMVNENKALEEKVLRRVDAHVRNRDSQEIDQASVQIARRHVEDAFYRLNRAIMQPKRILGDLD